MKKRDFSTSAKSSALRILRGGNGKRPLAMTLSETIASMLAERWQKTGAASKEHRFRLSSDARKEAIRIAKRVEWMTNPDRHHGEQAAALARRTLGALQRRSIALDDLADKCKQYSQLRAKHIARRSFVTPRAEPRSINLSESNLHAHRLVTAAAINKVGHQMRNCLANTHFGKEIKSRLFRSDVEIYTIANPSSIPEAIVCLSAGGEIEQVKGPNISRPFAARGAIIEFLTKRKAEVGECSDLLELGVCDELIQARLQTSSKTFAIEEKACEVGDGFLIVIWNECTALLRSDTYARWGRDACVVASPEYGRLARAEFRVWLRRACRGHRRFAEVCREAFRNAPDIFRGDWLDA